MQKAYRLLYSRFVSCGQSSVLWGKIRVCPFYFYSDVYNINHAYFILRLLHLYFLFLKFGGRKERKFGWEKTNMLYCTSLCFYMKILILLIFFLIMHNSKPIWCVRILCILNDSSVNGDHSYLFWASCELRLRKLWPQNCFPDALQSLVDTSLACVEDCLAQQKMLLSIKKKFL